MGGACFRRADARRNGISNTSVTKLVDSGELRQVLRGVYVDSRRPDDLSLRAEALALVCPRGGAVARRSAAWLRGVDARGPDEWTTVPDVECIVPRGVTPMRRAGVRCYEAALGDDIEVIEGIPVTTALRTAVDLLRWLPPYLALGSLDALAHKGFVTPEAVQAEVERWPRHRNVDNARRLASFCEPATESPPESWLRLRMIDAGFPRPQVQVRVALADGTTYRIDLGDPERRLGWEYDGLEFHSSREARRHDEERRRRLRMEAGWSILVVGRGEVLGRKLDLERAIGEMLGMAPQILRRTW
jgi:hypothetical protein